MDKCPVCDTMGCGNGSQFHTYDKGCLLRKVPTEKEVERMRFLISFFKKRQQSKDNWNRNNDREFLQRLIAAYALCIHKGMYLTCDEYWTLHYVSPALLAKAKLVLPQIREDYDGTTITSKRLEPILVCLRAA